MELPVQHLCIHAMFISSLHYSWQPVFQVDHFPRVFSCNSSLRQLLASALTPSLSCSTQHVQVQHPQLIQSGCEDILFEMYRSATADYKRARDTLLTTQRELKETGNT